VAIALAFAVCLGCTGAPETYTASAPQKPHAPLEIQLSAQELGGGRYQVTLEARPRLPVTSVTLEVRGAPPATFGPTAAGERRELVVETAGGELIGLARVETARGPMGRAVSLRTGPQPAAKRAARVVITPFGPVAAE
jgi:hypothetical protein